MKILLLATLLLLPAPADAADPGPEALCELLWTQPLPPSRFPPDLTSARDLAVEGEDVLAAEALETRMAEVLERASKVLRSDALDVELAREFMDRYVRAKTPLLAARGDLLVPTLPLATWAASLHCRGGDRDAAVRYLRGAWRDYGRDELRLSLFLTFLRFGEIELATPLAPTEPVGWREKAGAGWHACVTGATGDGSALLEQANTLAPDSHIREAIGVLAKACK
ncbi:MAG: hypothetical protein ABIK09_17675 [Pseudomonadota bacterium]